MCSSPRCARWPRRRGCGPFSAGGSGQRTISATAGPSTWTTGWTARRHRLRMDRMIPPPSAFVPNAEVDELVWLPLTAAGDRLSYQHDREVLSEFASAPAATTALILVRHTSARNRKAWQNAGHPDDLTRPLTPLGQTQAKLLGQILSCLRARPGDQFGSGTLPGDRRALRGADRRGGGADARLRASAAPASRRPEARSAASARAAARGLVTGLVTTGEPVVICAHRENLPACCGGSARASVRRAPAGPPLPKGAFWACIWVGAGSSRPSSTAWPPDPALAGHAGAAPARSWPGRHRVGCRL